MYYSSVGDTYGSKWSGESDMSISISRGEQVVAGHKSDPPRLRLCKTISWLPLKVFLNYRLIIACRSNLVNNKFANLVLNVIIAIRIAKSPLNHQKQPNLVHTPLYIKRQIKRKRGHQSAGN